MASSEPLDLLVIGAGPHALSLLTRLIDDDPDLLTEKERMHVVKKAGSRGKTHKAVVLCIGPLPSQQATSMPLEISLGNLGSQRMSVVLCFGEPRSTTCNRTTPKN